MKIIRKILLGALLTTSLLLTAGYVKASSTSYYEEITPSSAKEQANIDEAWLKRCYVDNVEKGKEITNYSENNFGAKVVESLYEGVTRFVPISMFQHRGVYTYVGKEYGFHVETSHEDFYEHDGSKYVVNRSEVFLFSIEDQLIDNQVSITIKPIVDATYRYYCNKFINEVILLNNDSTTNFRGVATVAFSMYEDACTYVDYDYYKNYRASSDGLVLPITESFNSGTGAYDDLLQKKYISQTFLSDIFFNGEFTKKDQNLKVESVEVNTNNYCGFDYSSLTDDFLKDTIATTLGVIGDTISGGIKKLVIDAVKDKSKDALNDVIGDIVAKIAPKILEQNLLYLTGTPLGIDEQYEPIITFLTNVLVDSICESLLQDKKLSAEEFKKICNDAYDGLGEDIRDAFVDCFVGMISSTLEQNGVDEASIKDIEAVIKGMVESADTVKSIIKWFGNVKEIKEINKNKNNYHPSKRIEMIKDIFEGEWQENLGDAFSSVGTIISFFGSEMSFTEYLEYVYKLAKIAEGDYLHNFTTDAFEYDVDSTLNRFSFYAGGTYYGLTMNKANGIMYSSVNKALMTPITYGISTSGSTNEKSSLQITLDLSSDASYSDVLAYDISFNISTVGMNCTKNKVMQLEFSREIEINNVIEKPVYDYIEELGIDVGNMDAPFVSTQEELVLQKLGDYFIIKAKASNWSNYVFGISAYADYYIYDENLNLIKAGTTYGGGVDLKSLIGFDSYYFIIKPKSNYGFASIAYIPPVC